MIILITYIDMWNLVSAVKGIPVMDLMCDINIDSRIDKEMLMNWILRNAGSNYSYFYEVEPFLVNHKLWFGVKYKVIEGLINAEDIEYEPLDDYRMEEIRDRDRGLKDDTATTTGSTTDIITSGTENTNGSNENKTSAFNEILYQPKELDTIGNKVDTSENEHSVNNGNADTNRNVTENEDTKIHKHGKIGTSSFQSLVRQERELKMWNIYDWITREYKKDNVYLIR